MRKSPVYTEEELQRKRQLCIDRNTTHGMSKLPEYKIWKGIKKRCFNKNDKRFEHYGGRGITIFDGWVDNFPAFYDYIGPRPEDGQRWSVGRIDNNDDYKPGNVRWELDFEQARNHSLQRNNKTGHAGIALRTKIINGKSYTSYVATVRLDGKRACKEFSTHKYGNDCALNMSLDWRAKKLDELKDVGIFYAESHGTLKRKGTDGG